MGEGESWLPGRCLREIPRHHDDGKGPISRCVTGLALVRREDHEAWEPRTAMSPAFSDIIGRLKAAGQVTAADVLAMRAEVYGAPQVACEDIEALIALDAS